MQVALLHSVDTASLSTFPGCSSPVLVFSLGFADTSGPPTVSSCCGFPTAERKKKMRDECDLSTEREEKAGVKSTRPTNWGGGGS